MKVHSIKLQLEMLIIATFHREYFLHQLLLPIYLLPGHSGSHFQVALSALPRWLDTIELKKYYVAKAEKISIARAVTSCT